MRRTTLCCLTLALFAAAPLHAQPDSLWSRTYGGRGRDMCRSLIQTADGGYALAGFTDSFGAGREDFWLVKTDENGDSLWSHTYGGEWDDACNSLVQTADGGFALAGLTYSFGAGESDFWLVRTNESGDSLWSRTYGSWGSEWCSSCVRTADGGFALAGVTTSLRRGEPDFWLVKTNNNGETLWSQVYGGSGYDMCYSIVQTVDGGFALAGGTQSFGNQNGYYDLWLVKTSENGDSLWSRTYGGETWDLCFALIQTANGGFALAGETTSFGAGQCDIWLLRTDENGNTLWSRTVGGEYDDESFSLIQTADRGFALAGFTQISNVDKFDFYLARTDENGDSLWSRTFGGDSSDVCESLIQTADGGFALAGYTKSFGAGNSDFWLVKLGPENSVPDDEATAPLHFGLDAVYPNPFNSTAAVSYQLSAFSKVSLKLYDLNGRLVQTLMEGWQEAGEHRVVIDANGGQPGMAVLPSGVYLLRLTDGRQVALGKVCLVK